MAIPDYETLLPTLQIAADKNEHSFRETIDLLAQKFNLTEEERKELLPSGRMLTQIKKRSPEKFENLVIELLVQMGYGGSIKEAGEVIGRSGDEGIDGTIKEDVLGLDVIYIQAKKWDTTVGRPEVQKFAGALQGRRARKGIL